MNATPEEEEDGFLLGESIVIPVTVLVVSDNNEEEEFQTMDHGAKGGETEKQEGQQKIEEDGKLCLDNEESKEISNSFCGVLTEDGDGTPCSAVDDVKPPVISVEKVTLDEESSLMKEHSKDCSESALRCGQSQCPGAQRCKCHATKRMEEDALRCEVCGSSPAASCKECHKFTPPKTEDCAVKSEARETRSPAADPCSKGGMLRGGAVFACKECHYTTNNSYNLSCHARTHTGERPFMCPRCSRGFRTRSCFNRHKLSQHCPELAEGQRRPPHKPARPVPVKVKKTLWACKHCSYSTINSYNLKVHLRIHSDERPYGCDRCKSAFRTQSHLYRHERSHQNVTNAPVSTSKCSSNGSAQAS